MDRGQLAKDVATRLEEIRRVRNAAAHTPGRVEDAEIHRVLELLRELSKRLPLT